MPKIKEKLIELGKSVQWLADSCETDRPTMSHIVHFDYLPIPALKDRICNTLECGTLDLWSMSEVNYTLNQFNECARSKYERARCDNLRTHENIFNFCVRIEKKGYPLLNKKVLQKCGFRTYADFMNWAVNEQLQHRYDWITKKEQACKDSACSKTE